SRSRAPRPRVHPVPGERPRPWGCRRSAPVWVPEPTMADDLAGLIVPGTPLLVPGVDRREPPELAHLRDRIADLLRESDTWVVPLAATAVPPLLSLGGLGIDAGARVRMSPGCGRVGPAELV